jgi:hypothetical protein
MPESSFVAQYREQIPRPDRRTMALASWRATVTGQATAAVAARGGRGAARGGRGRSRGGRGKGSEKGRTQAAKGAPYWLWDEGQEKEPEEYQNVEVNNTQNAPGDNSDEN